MKKLLYLLLFWTFLLGCKHSDDDEVVAENPPPEPPPGENGVLTDAQRIVALDECRDKFAALEKLGAADKSQKMVEWLKSKPYISAAGFAVEEKNVWAHFKDGRSIMFVNNLQKVPYGQQSGRLAEKEFLDVVPTRSNARTSELPSQKKVSILNGMGTGFIDPTNAIKQIFAKSKTDYKVESAKASIENLKKIGKDHAIFFLNTHGGADSLKIVNGVKMPAVLGFWTTDTASIANEAVYKEELDNYRIGYMIAENDQVNRDSVSVETHYAITAKFVEKYMGFGENCLVYITACSGFRESPSGIQFRETVISKAEKQRAAYIGWTKPIYESDGYIAAKFVFDRLLGANSDNGNTSFPIPIEDPSQRPFDIDAVMKDLADRGLNISDVRDPKTGVIERSVMMCYNKTSEDDRVILAPSIAYVAVEEVKDKLHIAGIFGSDPKSDGEVTVDGVSLDIISWTKNEIVCTIPASGKGSAGDVVVKVRNHESNPVQLTEWQWKIQLTRTFAGSLKETVDLNLHLRADVHAYRKKPHGTPRPYVYLVPLPGLDSAQAIRPVSDSKGLYTSSGTASTKWSSGGCSYTDKEDWAGISVNLPLLDGPVSSPRDLMAPACWLNPKTKTMEFSFEWLATGRNWVYRLDQSCPGESIPPQIEDGQWYGQGLFVSPYFKNLQGMEEDVIQNFGIETVGFDNNFNIKPYSKTFTTDDNFGFIHLRDEKCMTTLKWEGVTAKFPPRTNSGARIANR
jgi:hypothetical protein